MPDAADVTEDAFGRLVLRLAGHLGSDGWRLRSYEVWPLAVFTRDVGGGFLATVEVFGRPLGDFLRAERWPVGLNLVFGCGYEPATALMPLLALAPKAALIAENRPAGDLAPDVTLSGPDSVVSTARAIADVITGHGLEFAEQHASVDALDAAMTDRDRLPLDIEVTLRPVLLGRGRTTRPRPSAGRRLHEAGRGRHRIRRLPTLRSSTAPVARGRGPAHRFRGGDGEPATSATGTAGLAVDGEGSTGDA